MRCAHDAPSHSRGASLRLDAAGSGSIWSHRHGQRFHAKRRGPGPAAHINLLGCSRKDPPHSRRKRLRLPSRCFTRNARRVTTRPLLMHVTPRTHCEREGDRALLGPVSILLRAQVKWAQEMVSRGPASSPCHHTAIPEVRYEGLAKSPIRSFHGERGQPERCVVLEDGLSRLLIRRSKFAD